MIIVHFSPTIIAISDMKIIYTGYVVATKEIRFLGVLAARMGCMVLTFKKCSFLSKTGLFFVFVGLLIKRVWGRGFRSKLAMPCDYPIFLVSTMGSLVS